MTIAFRAQPGDGTSLLPASTPNTRSLTFLAYPLAGVDLPEDGLVIVTPYLDAHDLPPWVGLLFGDGDKLDLIPAAGDAKA